jgi:hypothetical protein
MRAAIAIFASSLLFIGTTNAQTLVQATRLLSVGDPLENSTVAALSPVFTNGEGQPGSIVVLTSGARVVWSNGVLFNSASVVSPVLTGGEEALGFGNGGRFAYSPSVDGNDAIYTHTGVLLSEPQPIPGQTTFSSFNSRPNMLPDGRAFWVGGFTQNQGGATQGRILLRATTGASPVFETLLKSGDLVDGVAVGTTGISFGVAMSDDGNQLANVLLLDTGNTATDGAVRINSTVVAREGDAIGAQAPGENWQGLSLVSINNAGRWLLAGDTSGATATDAFLASNGVIQVREGSTLDGETLDTVAAVRAASINNRNQAIHIWNTNNNVRKAFFAADASRLDQSKLLLRTGSPLDFNSDGVADGTLIDIFGTTAGAAGVSLAEDSFVYFHISYSEGMTTRQSLVRIALDRVFGDGFES